MPDSKVSVFVVAGNEELNIERCLQSVAGWSDDVFVVDSSSTDRTNEIASRYTSQLHNHTYVDHASQLKWAFENLPFKHDWVLFLDADNVVTDKLKTQIDAALEDDNPRVNGYYSLHIEYFRDRPVRGVKKWWARLVRRSQSHIDNSELVDYRIVIADQVRYLSGAIIEDNLKENDIDFWIDKHQRFARRMAVEEILRRHGRIQWRLPARLFGNGDERRVWLKNAWLRMPLFWRPFVYWFYRYVLTGAIFQGMHGFIYTFLQAFWFRMLVDLKRFEFERALREKRATLEGLAQQFASKSVAGDIVGHRQPEASGK